MTIKNGLSLAKRVLVHIGLYWYDYILTSHSDVNVDRSVWNVPIWYISPEMDNLNITRYSQNIKKTREIELNVNLLMHLKMENQYVLNKCWQINKEK